LIRTKRPKRTEVPLVLFVPPTTTKKKTHDSTQASHHGNETIKTDSFNHFSEFYWLTIWMWF